MSEFKLSFLNIMENIKMFKNLRKDVEVADILGIKPVTLSQQKLRNSIPHDEVIDFCIKEGYSLDTIYGLSEMKSQSIAKKENGMIFCKDMDELETYLKISSASCRFSLECIGIESKEDTIALEYFDDTMEPTIKNGETVIIDLADKEIKSNGIYLVSYSGQYSFKRFVFTFADTIIVKGDNSTAIQFELPIGKLSDIVVIGRATRVLSVKKI